MYMYNTVGAKVLAGTDATLPKSHRILSDVPGNGIAKCVFHIHAVLIKQNIARYISTYR